MPNVSSLLQSEGSCTARLVQAAGRRDIVRAFQISACLLISSSFLPAQVASPVSHSWSLYVAPPAFHLSSSSTIVYSYTFSPFPHHINLIIAIMKLISLLYLAIPGATMATTTGTIPYPTCASGYYCNTTVTATSTTTSAAPTYTAFDAYPIPCPDNLTLSCCDFVPSNRSVFNGLFDNTTHFPGCKSISIP